MAALHFVVGHDLVVAAGSDAGKAVVGAVARREKPPCVTGGGDESDGVEEAVRAVEQFDADASWVADPDGMVQCSEPR